MKRGVGEIIAVILTGLGRFVFMNWLDWKAPYIITVVLGWSIYIGFRARLIPMLWTTWGFSKKNLAQTFQVTGLFAGVSLFVMAAIGYWQGSLTFTWHMLPLLALYPIWGFIQQFLVQGLVTGNLASFGWPRWVIIPFSGCLFGLVHLPYPVLTLATTVLGMVFAWIYLKWNNLWPLGLFHGWLGVFLYFWVLGRDPWAEVFTGM